ncbi:hypothetical protein BUALT_Bualt13G0042300 [Buddleja alternifolia]|uniref:THUMP domain-containing protein n=1 Tax=Buddleja alternifolia TaxID=168488 RepID=A0AAV6WRC9_9LAMI|nr:hypothetical protein BUALT_Bualt13G0042300 [Buddleja alternifolia]
MATENKSKPNKNNKKRKNYLPHNKPVKKGGYPLRPGVEGFFITCDGGREFQASREAIDVIDSFYEELVEGKESKAEQTELSTKPLNKIIKFASSDSDDDEDENDDPPKDSENAQIKEDKSENQIKDGGSLETKTEENKEKSENQEKQEAESVEPPVKKQCVEENAHNHGNLSKKVEEKSVDKLIEEELAELGDKSKRRFNKLDTGCNGVIFIQMRKRDGDPTPKEIVQHMMTSIASSRKHVSRFLLRVLPVEVSCYTSDEEIRRAITPVIEKHFPVETQVPRKFAVLYDARANTGIDRTKIIDTVAKCVPSPHKVDLSNPDINIVVQIVKTVCLIGIVEKYKELAKYNLRQLTSPTQ